MTRKFFAIAALFAAAIVACTPAAQSAGDNGEPEEPGGNEPAETVELTELSNLTPTFIGTVSIPEHEKQYEPGEEITLTLTPGEILSGGFMSYHMEHIHVHVADKVYIPVFPEGAEDGLSSLELTLTVPEENFGIVVAYAIQQQFTPDGYTMTLEENEAGIELFGVSPEQKYKYFDCYLRTPDAYTIDKVEFKMGNDDWKDVTSVQGCGFARTESLDWVYNVSIRPGYQNVTGDVVLRVSGTQQSRHKITWKNTEFIRTELPEGYQPNSLPEGAISGETVVASFWTKEDYYLNGASANVSGLTPECLYRSYVRFVMPDSDVEIALDFKEKIPLKAVAGAHIDTQQANFPFQFYDDNDIFRGVPVTKGIPGDYVWLLVSGEDGYKPDKVVNDKGEEAEIEYYAYKFYYARVHIPEGAESMTATATTKVAYTVSGENIQLNDGYLYGVGETVDFIVVIPAGKTVEDVTVKTAGGADVACSLDAAYGSFRMPADDVTVTVTYADTDDGDTVHVVAYFDEDQYSVRSSTNYDWDFAAGFDVAPGTNIYLDVVDWYGEPFWVNVNIGGISTYYEAGMDDMGEYSFGRSFTASADVVIKVGAKKDDVTL